MAISYDTNNETIIEKVPIMLCKIIFMMNITFLLACNGKGRAASGRYMFYCHHVYVHLLSYINIHYLLIVYMKMYEMDINNFLKCIFYIYDIFIYFMKTNLINFCFDVQKLNCQGDNRRVGNPMSYRWNLYLVLFFANKVKLNRTNIYGSLLFFMDFLR